MTGKPSPAALRVLHFDVQGRAADKRIPVVCSTDAPVDMGDCTEVLSHDPSAIDLSRAPLPIIASHRGGQVNVGLVEDLVPEGGRLRGWARFGERTEAAEYERDVLGGVIRSVSVGYRRVRAVRRADGVMLTTRWLPTHVAMVAEPADTDAGFYRHAPADAPRPDFQLDDAPADAAADPAAAQPAARAQPQDAGATQTPQRAAPAVPREPRMEQTMDKTEVKPVQGDEAFRANVQTIQRLAAAYEQYLKPTDVGRAIADGADAQKFNELIMERMASGATDATTMAAVGVTAREQKQYSFIRAIQGQIPGASADAGFEREVSLAIAKACGREAEGILVPPEVMFSGLMGRRPGEKRTERDFNVGTASQAGNLVQTTVDAAMWTDVLRPALVMAQLGVMVLPGLRDNVAIPRKTVAGTLAMLTEIGAASETQPTTALPVLTPKRVGAFVEPSKQSILQSGIAIEPMLRQDLLDGAAVLMEDQGINGSGSSPNARGIRNVSGIGSVVGGTNGLALSWALAVALETAVANANANSGSRAGYLINTKTRGTAKTTPKAANLPFMWDGGMEPLNGYRAAVTNNVPSNLTKGTSSGVCSSAVFSADWSMFVLGLFGGIDVTVDPFTLATTGQVRITLNMFFDWLCRQPGAFAVIDDLLTP